MLAAPPGSRSLGRATRAWFAATGNHRLGGESCCDSLMTDRFPPRELEPSEPACPGGRQRVPARLGAPLPSGVCVFSAALKAWFTVADLSGFWKRGRKLCVSHCCWLIPREVLRRLCVCMQTSWEGFTPVSRGFRH